MLGNYLAEEKTSSAVAPLAIRGPFNLIDNLREINCKALRYKANGFNLDLQYISPQIIAMAVPAEGTAAFYRNHTDHTDEPEAAWVRFLNWEYKGHYAVFNLVCEATAADARHSFPAARDAPAS